MRGLYANFLLAALLLVSGRTTARDYAVEVNDPWLGRDKASHLALSLSLVGFGYHLARCEADMRRDPARAASFGASLALGITKEMCDRRRPRGRFSYKDLLFDLAGAGLGLMIFTTNK